MTVPTAAFKPLPATKPAPLMVRFWFEAEPVIGFGVRLAMAGATDGAFTVKLTVLVALPPGRAT